MDIPNARSHREVIKKGYLQKLSARSFPYVAHPWKRKYILLVKGNLFYYDKEDSKGADKGSGVINLEYYDQVLEAAAKECKKATNVFTITSQDKGFFDQGRHLFSADSAQDMNEWIRQLKKTIEQTRNNNRTTTGATGSRSAASSPRPDSAAQSKIQKEKLADKKNVNVVKGKKRRGEEGNKENEDECFDSVDNVKYQDSSLRRKRTDQSSKSIEEAEVLRSSSATNSIGRKKSSEFQTEEASVTSNSLGRKGKGKTTSKTEFNYAPGDLEGMMSGSLGRQLKSAKNKGDGERTSSDSFGSSGSNLESKKRKADEDDDLIQSCGTETQLESVTKHRVKGPAGRRMPQSRRGLKMKHRANSLSALAHNGVAMEGGEASDQQAVSFIPWLNRSLDLLEDEQVRNSQSHAGYLYSDPEEEGEELFEYVGFNEETINYDDGCAGIIGYRNNDEMYVSGPPPPLPPRMESKPQRFQQQQLQQQFQQQQMHANVQNQMMSPFGTVIQKPHQRRSVALDEMGDVVMTQSINNDLFIASFSDGDNSGEQKIINKGQVKSKPNALKSNSQRGGKRIVTAQPDVNKFNIAVRNLQKHVVELDQAVNGITKEVEDSKSDLGNIRSGVTALKKEKDRLNDSVSIMTQEATKMKEQVSAALKESEKLQRNATAAMVVAEKAKLDQLNLKKEYENMIIDLKNTIDRIKKEALDNLRTSIDDSKNRLSTQLDEESDEENSHDVPERGRKGKNSRDSSKTRSSFFNRPASLISGLTSRSKSSSGHDDHDRLDHSPKSEKKISKNKSKSTKKVNKKSDRLNTDDIPMMDESIGTPQAMSPIGSDQELTDTEFANNANFDLEKSTSSPNVSNRPKALMLKSQKSESQSGCSPDNSPTRASSPFDVPRFHLNGRATSPTRYSMHRPGSTPGPLSRQGSMTTVPEDRAIDVRYSETRPSEPPPPPPTTHKGVFAISRQNSSPNIATQKASPALPRQASLGVVFEESKSNMSRQGSLLSVPDDRLIVDRTLPMSPSSSMMSFPGSWSTTSLNKQDSVNIDDRHPENLPKRKALSKNPLELVAGRIISGSSLQSGTIAPYEEKNDEPPLATSSLKRKKVKKNPIMV